MKNDLVHAVRALARTPILAAVVILSLGVGIGVNTVVFSWIQALVFRPLPGVADASPFHLIETRTEAGLRPGSSWLEYQDLRERVTALDDLMAFRMVPLNAGEASRNERTYGLMVSGNYFRSLGLVAAAGRLIRDEDAARPGGDAVAVLSYDYWQTRFGGAASAIGQTIRINDRDLVIIGVTPDGFQGTVLSLQFDVWVPATLAPVVLSGSRELEDRRQRGYYVMGRLRANATRDQAQAEASDAMRRLAETYPEANGSLEAEVLPFWRASRGPQGMLLQGLSLLQGIMIVLLLAVCGNTANLILARASARHREVGVRLAVGAGSWRIVRLLLVENAVLGLSAAVVGSLIAMWGTTALRAVPMLTTQFPVRFQTSLNSGSLVFAIALGLGCAVVFGAAPAAQLARVDPQTALRRGGASAPSGSLRSVLMAIEVALAVVVLVAAGLFLQSFRQTQDTHPGFTREGVLLSGYDVGGRGLGNDEIRLFTERLLEQLTAIPDVEAAAIATAVPLDIHGLPARSFTLEGRARTDGALDRTLSNTVTPGYLQTMRIPLVAGKDFAPLADRSEPPQAIVNQAFVTRYLDGGEPLGRRVTINDTAFTIVGVARDSLYEAFGEAPTPIVYLSYRDRPSRQGEIHLRSRVADETLLAPAVRRAVRTVDAGLPIYNVRTLTQHVDMNLVLRKIPARMFMVLGPLILVLAAIGIYAVVAYNVAQRNAEVGVRIALGATPAGVIRQIVSESLWVTAAGAVVGWTFIFVVYTRILRGPLDLPVFAGVPVLLFLIAALAAWLPARRVSTVDPVVALRAE
jgi:predicted permease